MMRYPVKLWIVQGYDPTPDGFRDHLLYKGDSFWQAIKAYRAARREGMSIAFTRMRHAGRKS